MIPMKRLTVDYRITPKDECVEHFTLKNLDSMCIVDRNNASTKSNILAPFCTSYKENDTEKDASSPIPSKLNSNKSNPFVFSEIKTNNNYIHYAPCVIDANREYELQNKENQDKGFLPYSNVQGSINLESSLYKEGNKPIILFNNQRNHNDNLYGKGHKRTSSKQDLIKGLGYGVYNDSIMNQMVEIGYSKEFITQSLRNNELNYCTACYYLLMKNVEKPEY